MKNTLVLWLTLSVGVAPLYAVPISVSVVDEVGAPIEKASVQLEAYYASPPGYKVAETGVDGIASLDIEPNKQFPDAYGRALVLKPGYALAGEYLTAKKPLKFVLKKGETLRGVVVDNNKKPLKGAKVTFSQAQSDGGRNYIYLSDGPLKAKMEVLTDENGAWQLDNLPSNTQIYVSIFAPGFVRERPNGKTGETIQTQLRIGASIRGKLLGLDGKPLEKVGVSAQSVDRNIRSNSYGEDVTKADGTFNLEGLEAGGFNVLFGHKDDDNYVVSAFEEVEVAVGESKNLPDARAVEGVMIGGKITEKGSNKPVSGASIGVYGGLNPSSGAAVGTTKSDENGVWKMRTLPGASRVYVMGIPTGFIRDQQTKNLEIGPQGDLNLNFELERASKITGKFVDENGKGIAASMEIRQKYQGWPASSDESGNFEVYGPKNGEIEFGAPRWNPTENSDWDVVGNAKWVLPAGGPIEVKLAKAKLAKFEARVYDDDDAAIEGAKVNVWVTTGTGDGQSSQPRELTSDKNGLVQITNLRTNQRVEVKSAQKSGYDLTSQFSVEQKDDFFRAKDIVLKKRNGKIEGRVVDAAGVAVKDAKVFASGIETITDQDGKFILAPLPNGKVDVVAFNQNEFAQISTDSIAKDVRVELKKQGLQPVDKARAAQIIDDLKKQSKDTGYWRKDWLDFNKGDDFEASVAALKNIKNENALAYLIERSGADQSISIDRWISLIIVEPAVSKRLYFSAMLIRKRGDLKDSQAVRSWLDDLQYDQLQAIKQNDQSDQWMAGIGLFAVPMLADKIGDTAIADKTFDEATNFIKKNYAEKSEGGKPSVESLLGTLGELVGISPRLLNKLLEQIKPDSSAYSQILRSGIPLAAQNGGLESVKPLLDKLKNAVTPKPDENGNTSSIEWAYWEAVPNAIEMGGKSNPQLALELAKSLPASSDYGNYTARDKALIAAAFFQEKAVAEPLWRMSLPRMEVGMAMKSIVKIAQTDEKLGRELYDVTRLNLDSQPEADPDAMMYGRQRDIPAFAFYESKFNAARARYRLEKEFLKAQKDENSRYSITSYVRAMSVLDAERALELANSLTNTGNQYSQFEAKRGIAQWLGNDEKKREKANFTAQYGQDWEF